MNDVELARLEHENFAAVGWRFCSFVDGARVERRDGVLVMLTDLPLRLANQVLIESDDASPKVVEESVAIARERGGRFVVTLRAGTDDRFEPLVRDLGLVRISAEPWMPGMAMHPADTAVAATAPSHEIRQVRDAEGVADHVHAAAEGSGIPEDVMGAMVGDRHLADPDVTIYVGYTDGEPVSAGLGLRTGRTIGVYNIATVERARRRGLGAAMTARVVADGVAAGCDVAILQASPMGFPIYQRLGFRTVVEYVGWVEPAPETAPQ